MLNSNDVREKVYITYLKAVSRGLILSIILLLIASAVFYLSDLSDEYMSTAIWIITVLSICYSCIYGAFRIGHKGFLHGALIAVIYTLVLMIIAILTERGQINTTSYMVMFIMSIVIGALAGMIGIIIGNKE